MNEIKRYTSFYGDLIEIDDGDYVLFSDYAAIVAELEQSLKIMIGADRDNVEMSKQLMDLQSKLEAEEITHRRTKDLLHQSQELLGNSIPRTEVQALLDALEQVRSKAFKATVNPLADIATMSFMAEEVLANYKAKHGDVK